MLFKKFSVLALLFFGILSGFSQPISNHFFGQNAWMPSWYYNGSLDDIWQKAQPANFEIIRIGGIEYEENFDNHIDDYLRFIDSIRITCHAEPILQVPRNYTEKQTQDLYDLVNVTKNKRVKYWSIGNEPDFHKPNTLPQIKDYFIRIAKALKDKNDSLIVIGPDYANYWVHPGDEWDAGKTTYSDFIKAVGMEMNTNKTAYLLDVFAFHNYIGYTIDKKIDNQDMERVVDNIRVTLSVINNKRTLGLANKATWGIGEINIASDGSARRTKWSFYAGQYFAMLYGLGLKKEAAFICPWSLIEGEYKKGTDLSMFENKANKFKPRSTFYHVKMLTDNRRLNYMKSTSTNELLKTIGMKDDTGFTIMLMNTDEKNNIKATIRLDLEKATATENVVKADAGLAVEFVEGIPANTTITLVLDATGAIQKRYTYSKADAEAYRVPSVSTGYYNRMENLLEGSIIVYPNVTNGELFFVDIADNSIVSAKVFNSLGELCLSRKISNNTIDISRLQSGNYVLHIETLRGKLIRKVIRQ